MLNKTKNSLVLYILLIECLLFGLSILVYMVSDERDFFDGFYGACMLISLQGQDDGAIEVGTKILIGIMSVCSSFIYIVSVWVYGEKYLRSENHRLNVWKTIVLGIFLTVSTFLIYMFIEERDFVDAFYGTCMLLSSLGQDEKPYTDTGKLLIGFLSIISGFLFGIMAWLVLEHYIIKDLNLGNDIIPENDEFIQWNTNDESSYTNANHEDDMATIASLSSVRDVRNPRDLTIQ
jgi:hypothetical protein